MTNRFAAALVACSLTIFSAGAATAQSETYWQCVPFARMFSGVQLFGDAWTWWQSATGRYATGASPESGAVLVFQRHGRMQRGHVAVVTRVLTERIVQVTHANWGGARGKVEEDVTVVDVSAQGDWSRVKVWYDPSGDLGTTVYPTYGFIYKTAPGSEERITTAAVTGAPPQAASAR